MKTKWWTWIMLAAGIAAGLIVYPDMPDRLPVHWGISGEADRFADKTAGLFLLPGIALLLSLFMEVSAGLEARRKHGEANLPNMYIIRNIVVLGLMLLQAYVIYFGYGGQLPISKVMAIVLGLIFIVTGNYMPRLRPNRFVGIRTPYTLSNPDAWRKANRLGGMLFAAGGALMLLTLALPTQLQTNVLPVLIVLTALSQLYARLKAGNAPKP
ncbi:SdpI family protein [Paenibacillus thailandensis]|uniref:SdpI family protein n=1 Tax=Paenibacillus thailandensis TaxID=393250 RepID=A0ABW5QTC9_9BACL